MNKKAQGMSMNIVVVAAIALLILVILIVVFVGRTGENSDIYVKAPVSDFDKELIACAKDPNNFQYECKPTAQIENNKTVYRANCDQVMKKGRCYGYNSKYWSSQHSYQFQCTNLNYTKMINCIEDNAKELNVVWFSELETQANQCRVTCSDLNLTFYVSFEFDYSTKQIRFPRFPTDKDCKAECFSQRW